MKMNKYILHKNNLQGSPYTTIAQPFRFDSFILFLAYCRQTDISIYFSVMIFSNILVVRRSVSMSVISHFDPNNAGQLFFSNIRGIPCCSLHR